MRDDIYAILLTVVIIGGLIAAGVAIFVSNWNECRILFSFLYCLTTLLK